jgi:peptidoglycan-associated lipoprotein
MNAYQPSLPRRTLVGVALVALLGASCVRNPTPVEPERPDPPPGARQVAPVTPRQPAVRDAAPPPPLPPLLPEEDIASRPLEEINREAPLQAVFFGYDSSELDAAGRAAVEANASILQRNPLWVIAIEGHCDSRGTPEYNLALGERRAYAVRDHLVNLGISPDRVQTISYGEEFPFVPGETEDAWAANRRAHFVVTGQ